MLDFVLPRFRDKKKKQLITVTIIYLNHILIVGVKKTKKILGGNVSCMIMYMIIQ